jgi:hypothetical protein
MKRAITMLLILLSVSAAAQTNRKPVDGTKQTDKSAQDMTNVKKAPGETVANDRSAGSGGSLTVEDSKNQKSDAKKKQQIPDGTYGTNRSGMPYSDDPNYPYDRDGNLIQNKNVEIIRGTQTGAPGKSGTTPKTEQPQQKATK